MLQVRGPMMAQRTWRDATMKVDVWAKDRGDHRRRAAP
jgi:hypothetical protein